MNYLIIEKGLGNGQWNKGKLKKGYSERKEKDASELKNKHILNIIGSLKMKNS